MAKKRLTPQDRIALDNWNELVASVREHSDINPTDTETEIELNFAVLKLKHTIKRKK